MDESSLLETTAEVAVAFTGFIGIFLVLATRESRFLPGESWSIRLIVVCSVAPAFFAVLPLILFSLGLAGANLWRVCSGVILASGLLAAPYMTRRLRELPAEEGRALNLMFWFALLALFAAIVNLFGWPVPPSGGLYLVVIWSIIVVAAGNFVGLIFSKVL
jgi:hypothetical protein